MLLVNGEVRLTVDRPQKICKQSFDLGENKNSVFTVVSSGSSVMYTFSDYQIK